MKKEFREDFRLALKAIEAAKNNRQYDYAVDLIVEMISQLYMQIKDIKERIKNGGK